MREMGVAAFRSNDLEIALGPAPVRPQDPEAKSAAPSRSDYDKMLFAATEGLPEGDE